jgi:hypothetical protein
MSAGSKVNFLHASVSLLFIIYIQKNRIMTFFILKSLLKRADLSIPVQATRWSTGDELAIRSSSTPDT